MSKYINIIAGQIYQSMAIMDLMKQATFNNDHCNWPKQLQASDTQFLSTVSQYHNVTELAPLAVQYANSKLANLQNKQ